MNYEDIKTWDQFKEAGVKYHEATGKYFACVETSASWMVNLMLAQKGGDYVDANGDLNLTSKELTEVLEYIKGMQETGAFATVPGGQPITRKRIQATIQGNMQCRLCLSGRHPDL